MVARNGHTGAAPDKVVTMLQLKTLGSIAIFFTASLILSSCATNEQTGRLMGAAAGAAAGTQVGDGNTRTIATIGGAILGGVIGGAIGSRMDDNDHRQTSYALENSPTGYNTEWVNPDNGYRYNMQPTSTYQTSSGPCRNYTMNAVIDGRNELINGTACRQSNGTWQ